MGSFTRRGAHPDGQVWPYASFISFSAQATAASGDSPWTAFANMSTMMYFDCTSETFWSAGPGYPSGRAISGDFLKICTAGGNLSQIGLLFCFGPLPL